MQSYFKKILFLIFCCAMQFACTTHKTHKLRSKNTVKTERQVNANFIKISNIEYHKNSNKWSINVVLENERNEDVAISSVISGCSCIKTEYDKKTISHLEKFNLEITYTPYNQETYFRKSIMLLFNEGKYYKIINFSH